MPHSSLDGWGPGANPAAVRASSDPVAHMGGHTLADNTFAPMDNKCSSLQRVTCPSARTAGNGDGSLAATPHTHTTTQPKRKQATFFFISVFFPKSLANPRDARF